MPSVMFYSRIVSKAQQRKYSTHITLPSTPFQGMLPGFRGCQDFSFVPIICGTDVDHVNRRIRQQIVNRRVGPRNSVLRRISPCRFRARTHYRRYRAIGLRINRFEHPGLCGSAGNADIGGDIHQGDPLRRGCWRTVGKPRL
jgi:hypothetical protein